jgi:hypothetical protein
LLNDYRKKLKEMDVFDKNILINMGMFDAGLAEYTHKIFAKISFIYNNNWVKR